MSKQTITLKDAVGTTRYSVPKEVFETIHQLVRDVVAKLPDAQYSEGDQRTKSVLILKVDDKVYGKQISRTEHETHPAKPLKEGDTLASQSELNRRMGFKYPAIGMAFSRMRMRGKNTATLHGVTFGLVSDHVK